MKEILILDDDYDIRNLWKMTLEHDNYKVYSCSTIEEALAYCGSNIDLAIIDFRLGYGRTGLELLRNIHCHECKCKKILVSAWADDERIIRCKDAFDEILKKPITYDIMLETVERLIGPAIDYQSILEN